MLWTVISFSILTLLCAFAPNPWIFGLLSSSRASASAASCRRHSRW